MIFQVCFSALADPSSTADSGGHDPSGTAVHYQPPPSAVPLATCTCWRRPGHWNTREKSLVTKEIRREKNVKWRKVILKAAQTEITSNRSMSDARAEAAEKRKRKNTWLTLSVDSRESLR